MNGQKNRTALARRALAFAFALALLLQSGAPIPPARAIEADPATGTVTLYRWDRCDDLESYAKNMEAGWRYLLLTWTDGGQRYYFRAPKTQNGKNASYKNVGRYTNVCTYSLSNAAVSAQPVLEAALNADCRTFFTTEIDASLAFSRFGNPGNAETMFAFCSNIGATYSDGTDWTWRNKRERTPVSSRRTESITARTAPP